MIFDILNKSFFWTEPQSRRTLTFCIFLSMFSRSSFLHMYDMTCLWCMLILHRFMMLTIHPEMIRNINQMTLLETQYIDLQKLDHCCVDNIYLVIIYPFLQTSPHKRTNLERGIHVIRILSFIYFIVCLIVDIVYHVLLAYTYIDPWLRFETVRLRIHTCI